MDTIDSQPWAPPQVTTLALVPDAAFTPPFVVPTDGLFAGSVG